MTPETVVQSGHLLGITSVHFSPSGWLVATCSADESVRLWDLRIGCELRAFTGHTGPVYSVRFSPDGRLVASASFDKSIRVWDVITGALVKRFVSFTHPVQKVIFSGSGDVLLGFTDYFGVEIRSWQLSTGHAEWSVDFEVVEAAGSVAVAISPNGRLLATCGEQENAILLRELSLDREPRRVAEIEDLGRESTTRPSLEFSSDGSMLVVAGNGISPRIIAIDTALGGGGVSPLSDAAEFQSLDMQPDGTLVGFKKNSVELWDVPERRLTKRIPLAADAISPDGQLAAVAEGATLVIRDTATRRRIFGLGSRLDIKEPIGNLRRVFSLAMNPVYPTVASAGPDGCIRLWDLRKSGGPVIWKGHESFIEALAFDRRGLWLASGGSDGWIKLWSATAGEARGEIPFYGGVKTLAFSNDARYLVATGSEKTGQIIDLSSGKHRSFDLDEQGGESTNIVFEPGGGFLLATRTGLFQFSAPGLERKLLLKAGNAVALAIAREGQLAVAGSLRKWVEGLMAAQREEVEGEVGSAVLLFDPRTQSSRTLIGKSRYVRDAAFSPDAQQLATACGDGTINLWDLAAGQEPHVWQAHVGDVTGVGYTPDGRFMVSIGMDSAVRFWDPSTRELRLTMVSMSAEDYIAVTATGSYMTSRGGLQSVVFRLGDRAVPFDQFDLNLNRPDQVYRELGYAYDDTIDAYQAAYGRRLKRMGFDSSSAPDAADLELPTVALVSEPPPASTADRSLMLTVRAEGKHIPLERLLVYANEVPLPSMAGLRVPAGALTNETTVDVELKSGDNLIQVSVLNQAGTESIRESLRVAYVGRAPAPTLHVLAVGVSEYAQQQLNLKYAAKDAEDLVATIRERQTHFGRVRGLLLLNDEASKDRILAARTFLMESEVDDQVILFFAGHGMLEGSDYYFVPSNFDPGAVADTAVRYEEIEALVDGAPARRRLVLIDTCHAGEVDETVAIERSATTTPPAAIEVTSFRHSLPDAPAGVQRTVGVSDVLLAESFADLRRRSGAFIIGAAGASEYALEQADLRNGVFTSCILEALRGTPSSRPLWADGMLRVSELHRYVSERVPKLTAGRQRPISRAENLVDDFGVM